MTATGYNAVTDSELEPGKPLTTGLAFRFRDNPLALAQRGAGAPWLNGIGAIQEYDQPGTYTWTVPTGVYRAEFTIIGGGGHGANLASGQNSSVSGVAIASGGGVGVNRNGFCSNNGGIRLFSVAGASAISAGVGGRIVIRVVNTTPGSTYTVTVGAGGQSIAAPSENGGHGIVFIRY
jgi:hypothetical protein